MDERYVEQGGELDIDSKTRVEESIPFTIFDTICENGVIESLRIVLYSRI